MVSPHPNDRFRAIAILTELIDANAERVTVLATGGTRRGVSAENRDAIDRIKTDNWALRIALAALEAQYA